MFAPIATYCQLFSNLDTCFWVSQCVSCLFATSPNHLQPFKSFLTVYTHLNHFWQFTLIFSHFWSFYTCFQHFFDHHKLFSNSTLHSNQFPLVPPPFHLLFPIFTDTHFQPSLFIFQLFFYVFSRVYTHLQPTTSIFNKQRPPLFISHPFYTIFNHFYVFFTCFRPFLITIDHEHENIYQYLSFIIFKFYFAHFIYFKLFMVIFLLTLPDGLPLWGHPVRLLQCTYPSQQLPGRLVLLRQYPSYNNDNSMLYRYTMIHGKGLEFVNVWQIA